MACEHSMPKVLHHIFSNVVCLYTAQVGWVLFNILEPAQVI